MELKQSRSDSAAFKQWSVVQFGPAALSCSPTLHEGRVKFAERQAEDSDSQRRTGDGETLDVYQTYKSVCVTMTHPLYSSPRAPTFQRGAFTSRGRNGRRAELEAINYENAARINLKLEQQPPLKINI